MALVVPVRVHIPFWNVVLAIGLVLLLVGAPGYLAASEAERSIAPDGRVPLKALADGDEATFAFVFTFADGSAIMSPPALHMRAQVNDEGTSLEWTQYSMQTTARSVSYASREVVMRVDHDPQGRPLHYALQGFGHEYEAAYAVIDVGTLQHLRVDVHRPSAGSLLGPAQYDALAYTPSRLQALLEEGDRFGVDGLLERPAGDGTGLGTAFVAWEHNDTLLLGTDPRRWTPDEAPPLSVNGDTMNSLKRPHVTLDHPLGTNVVHTTAPLPWTEAIAWDWYNPRLGVAAGTHQEFRNANGALILAVDLIPIQIEDHPAAAATAQPLDEAATPQGILLGELEHDRATLHQNLSMAGLRTAMEQPEAPQALHAFLEGGGWIAGYTYDPRGRLLLSLQDDVPNPLRGQKDPPGATHSWHVVLARPDGQVLTVWANVTETPAPDPHNIRFTVTCDKPVATTFIVPDCTNLPPDRTDPTRLVAPPAATLAAARAAHAAHGHDHGTQNRWSYLPLARVVQDDFKDPLFRLKGSWSDYAASGLRWLPEAPSNGMAFYLTTGVRDRTIVDLDGAVVRLVDESPHIEEPAVSDSTPPTLEARSTPAPTVVDSVDARLMTTGFVLMLVGAMARGTFWFWSQVAWAIGGFLYSRIPRERALRHETRTRVLDLLRAEPAMTLKEIAVALALGWGTAVHHLQTLERAGYVTSIAEGRTRHFFVAGALGRQEMMVRLAQRKPDYARFLTYVHGRPGAALSDVMHGVRKDRAAASRLGSRLARLGLVRKLRQDRQVVFYPVPVDDGAMFPVEQSGSTPDSSSDLVVRADAGKSDG